MADRCITCLYASMEPKGTCGMSYLLKHPYVKNDDIAEAFGVSPREASHKVVKTLVEKGFLDSDLHGKARKVMKEKINEVINSCRYLEKGIVQSP